MLTSKEKHKRLEIVNDKLLEIMNDRRIIACCLLSPLSKITDPENTRQFNLVKDSNSNRVSGLLIHNTIPVSLYKNLLTFRDSNKQFELKGDLLKMIINNKFSVDLAILSDKKLMYDFAKEMHFDIRGLGNKSIRDRTLIKLLKSSSILASGISTIFLSSDPNELCDRLKLLLQQKQAGNNSDLIDKEIVAIVDNLLEYKSISKKQDKQILIKCNLLHK